MHWIGLIQLMLSLFKHFLLLFLLDASFHGLILESPFNNFMDGVISHPWTVVSALSFGSLPKLFEDFISLTLPDLRHELQRHS